MKPPLGLPVGSVRAIIALVLVVTVCIIGLASLAYGIASGLIADPTAIVLAIVGLGNLVVTAYFVTRPTTPPAAGGA